MGKKNHLCSFDFFRFHDSSFTPHHCDFLNNFISSSHILQKLLHKTRDITNDLNYHNKLRLIKNKMELLSYTVTELITNTISIK